MNKKNIIKIETDLKTFKVEIWHNYSDYEFFVKSLENALKIINSKKKENIFMLPQTNIQK
jgi:hypothetical protein